MYLSILYIWERLWDAGKNVDIIYTYNLIFTSYIAIYIIVYIFYKFILTILKRFNSKLNCWSVLEPTTLSKANFSPQLFPRKTTLQKKNYYIFHISRYCDWILVIKSSYESCSLLAITSSSHIVHLIVTIVRLHVWNVYIHRRTYLGISFTTFNPGHLVRRKATDAADSIIHRGTLLYTQFCETLF